MNPFEMTVLIVAIVMIAKVFSAKYRGERRTRRDGAIEPTYDADTARLRDEVRALKERIAVLERIATDNNRGIALDREIEALRSRD